MFAVSFVDLGHRLDRLAALHVTPVAFADELPGKLYRLPSGQEVDDVGLAAFAEARGVRHLIIDDIVLTP